MKRWKTTINVSLSRNQLNSFFLQIFVDLLVCRQHVIFRIFAVNQNASINKNFKNSNSKSLKQHTFAKSISFCCFCFCILFWNIDRFIILICKYFRDQDFQQDFHFRDFIFSVFALLFLFSNLSFHVCRICFETFCFNDDQTDIWITIYEFFNNVDRSRKVNYSLRDEVWRRRENSVTNMFEISIESLFYQRKFISKLVKTWRTFLFLTFDFHVDICFLDQIFSFCYLFIF